jgi:hypothetical protein
MNYYDALNLGAILSSLSLIAGYHIYLRFVFKTSPKATVYGLTSSARRVFVAAIMNRKNEILAVQTLRNWIMMASAMASTAIVIIIGKSLYFIFLFFLKKMTHLLKRINGLFVSSWNKICFK